MANVLTHLTSQPFEIYCNLLTGILHAVRQFVEPRIFMVQIICQVIMILLCREVLAADEFDCGSKAERSPRFADRHGDAVCHASQAFTTVKQSIAKQRKDA